MLLVTTTKSRGCRMLISRMTIAMTATRITGTYRGLSRSEIRASLCEPGNPLSLAIAKIILTAPVWFARQQTKIAMAAQTSECHPRSPACS